jgi:hypothetical protein
MCVCDFFVVFNIFAGFHEYFIDCFCRYVYWNEKLVGKARGSDRVSFEFAIAKRQENTLRIMTQTLGLSNFGPHRESWARGLMGSVYLNGVEVTEGGWVHQAGLQGEKRKVC